MNAALSILGIFALLAQILYLADRSLKREAIEHQRMRHKTMRDALN